MFSCRSLNYLVVFVVLLSNGCDACFRSSEHQSISITTSSSFYQECQCTEPGYTINNLRWLNNHDLPIEPLGPGTNSNVYVEEQSDSINLYISKITKTMSGTYKCVTEVDGVTYTQSYTIAAYEPLYFYQTPNDQYLVKGLDSSIKCQPKSDSNFIVNWQKEQEEPVEIANDDKYSIENDGLMIRNVTEDDAGIYKCTARVIATNEEVDKYIKVEVMTIPQIKELDANPGTTVVVGSYLSIECKADGIPHPQYVWNKTLEADEKESNATWRQEINTIIFESIKPEDRGWYTCYAYNIAGFHTMDIFLDVLIPPTITNFPNVTEVEGSTIQLTCNATGKSDPYISITYEGKDLNSDIDLINYEVMPNMAFINLDRAQEGIYVCNATNEVDSVQKPMYLTVLHRPYFEEQIENIWGWDGKTVNLSCVQDSNPPATISWRFQGNDILTDEEVQINKKLLSTLNKMPEPYFTLTIDNETAYGVYECTAKNKHGEATKFITLKEGFKPNPISNVSIDDLTATSVTFLIEGPNDVNGPPVIGYTATYDEASNYNITDIHTNRTWANNRPFKLNKLKPNTTYYAQFAALNEVGAGGWSDYIEFTTLDKSVPEAPEWEEVPIVLTSNSHVLKWKAPYDNGEPIDSYTLRYCHEQGDLSCKTISISPSTELELKDLEFNATYFLELVAHNAEGDSLAGNVSVVVPAPEFTSSALLTSGAVIGISIVIVVLCLLILDVLLLVWRRQGIIATCCYKKDNKRKENELNSRDKKGLLTNGEPAEEARPAGAVRPESGHKEYQYNKNTGVVTGKHSAV